MFLKRYGRVIHFGNITLKYTLYVIVKGLYDFPACFAQFPPAFEFTNYTPITGTCLWFRYIFPCVLVYFVVFNFN